MRFTTRWNLLNERADEIRRKLFQRVYTRSYRLSTPEIERLYTLGEMRWLTQRERLMRVRRRELFLARGASVGVGIRCKGTPGKKGASNAWVVWLIEPAFAGAEKAAPAARKPTAAAATRTKGKATVASRPRSIQLGEWVEVVDPAHKRWGILGRARTRFDGGRQFDVEFNGGSRERFDAVQLLRV